MGAACRTIVPSRSTLLENRCCARRTCAGIEHARLLAHGRFTLRSVKARAYRRAAWLLVLAVAMHWLPSFAMGGPGFQSSLCTTQGIVPGDGDSTSGGNSADAKHGCGLCGGIALPTNSLAPAIPPDRAGQPLYRAGLPPNCFQIAWAPAHAAAARLTLVRRRQSTLRPLSCGRHRSAIACVTAKRSPDVIASSWTNNFIAGGRRDTW